MSLISLNSIGRIMDIFVASEGELRPHCIVTGPSGSGKSHNISLLCEARGIAVMDINAAGLTKEGTAGNSLSKALSPLMQLGSQLVVCFVDEFDKLFISGNTNSSLAHETTNGVQNEFLKVLEGTANVYTDYGKYVNISTKNVLFVFAGAFNGEENIDLDRLREFGLKTEFLGRVGLVYPLVKLTLAEMKTILQTSPQLAMYLQLTPSVHRKKVEEDIMKVIKDNYEKNTIGARLINTLIHQYFIEGGLKPKEVAKTTFQKTLTMP